MANLPSLKEKGICHFWKKGMTHLAFSETIWRFARIREMKLRGACEPDAAKERL